MSKQQAETFAMGRFGTVVPCSTTTPLSDELVMLGRLIGTHDRRGTAEARGIVERAIREHEASLAALRALVAECRAHLDYEEDDDMDAACESAEDAISAAEGRR